MFKWIWPTLGIIKKALQTIKLSIKCFMTQFLTDFLFCFSNPHALLLLGSVLLAEHHVLQHLVDIPVSYSYSTSSSLFAYFSFNPVCFITDLLFGFALVYCIARRAQETHFLPTSSHRRVQGKPSFWNPIQLQLAVNLLISITSSVGIGTSGFVVVLLLKYGAGKKSLPIDNDDRYFYNTVFL